MIASPKGECPLPLTMTTPPNPYRSIAKDLTLGKCGLLDLILQHRLEPNCQDTFEQRVQKIQSHKNRIEQYPNLWPLIEARISLINTELFANPSAKAVADQRKKAMQRVIDLIGQAWNHQQADCTSKLLFANRPPAKWNSQWPILAELAKNDTWDHPGVLLVGETLDALHGNRRESKLTVHTHVLFAYGGSQKGLLARLTIERLDQGSGKLIPDPLWCGYLTMEETFSTGLQNALWAAHNYAEKELKTTRSDFDYRWSLDLYNALKVPKGGLYPLSIPLAGRSAEVAFACAMIAAHPDNADSQIGSGKEVNPLDPHVGATASIAFPGDPNREDLKSVGSIDDKTLIDRMETKRLVQIVIADTQNAESLPKDDRYEYCRAKSLKQAYEFMSRQPRITRGVNKYLRQWAKDHIQKNCNPWVCPDIQEVVEKDKRLVEEQDLRQSTTEPLIEDLRLLLRGRLEYRVPGTPEQLDKSQRKKRWVGNRVRIFADSGLGKSTWILQCQYHTARPESIYLPFRLGRTTGEDSALDLRWNEGDVVAKLLENHKTLNDAFVCFEQEQPTANRISIDDRKVWFRSMLRKGRVVLLIDALDQIVTDTAGMGTFLASTHVRECPVILTGRPEAALNRAQAFVNNQWRTLKMMPFDRPRQVKYLGRDLANQLLLEHLESEINWLAGSEDLWKHQIKDLVEVPLLLSMIKRLAKSENAVDVGGLTSIHNRYDLYQLAVKELIRQGWTSASQEQKNLLMAESSIREWLGKIAWLMIRSHDFSNVLEGGRYQSLRTSLKDSQVQLLPALKQIDLTTEYQILDRADAGGIAFRHRSFMEYFAACHWMALTATADLDLGEQRYQRTVPDTLRSKVLEEIHRLDDSSGPPNEDLLKRKDDWQETFRFALGHPSYEFRQELAKQLISMGNPWVVYQAIKRDRVKLPQGLEDLCRWLVHRDSPFKFEYRDAICETERDPSEIKQNAMLEIQGDQFSTEQMIDRETRDAGYLYTLRELVGDQAFYSTYSREANLLDRMRHLPSSDGRTWDFLDSFYTIPGGKFTNFRKYHSDYKGEPPQIATLALADFPVTNALFELFCPSHRRERDQYSDRDDDPVVYVSYWMALEFCQWLSAITGKRYRLPDDCEWEWATRWQDTCKEDYWWGPNINSQLCWCSENEAEKTRSRQAATEAHLKAQLYHPSRAYQRGKQGYGLLDLHGNVDEWQNNVVVGIPLGESERESSRLLVGGSWHFDAKFCCSQSRLIFEPVNRNDVIGFRICCF
jgi:formylglycine-generating enzyme required for sulfatase activity